MRFFVPIQQKLKDAIADHCAMNAYERGRAAFAAGLPRPMPRVERRGYVQAARRRLMLEAHA